MHELISVSLDKKTIFRGIILAALIAGNMLLEKMGLMHISSSTASFLASLNIMIVPLILLLLRKFPTKNNVFGIIIILGGLYGEAYAGGTGREDCYIVALEMEPERLKIGDFKYKTNAKQLKWGIHPKVQPKIAHLKNGKIVFDPLTKELLGSF